MLLPLRTALLVTLFLASSAACLHAVSFAHPGILHTANQLDRATSADALRQVVTLADSLINEPAEAVATFDVPGYFQNPTAQQTKVRQLQTDARAAYTCALAFQLTGKPAYAATAKRLVLAWVDTNKTVVGYDGPIVMTYLGVGFLLAADLTWDCFSTEEIARLRTWTHSVFFLQASNPEQLRHQNNHRTWGIYGSLVAAAITHDATLFTHEIAQWKNHVTASIAADGAMPLEIARGSSAGWYTYFALAPMTAGAQVIQNVSGERLWDHNQGAIERALRYLYANYANPDRLGAGSSCNPENLFHAVRTVYPTGPWATASYLNASTLDASQDQHIAWEFPVLLKATRTLEATGTPVPAIEPSAPTPTAPAALGITWLSDSSDTRMCEVTPVASSPGETLIAVEDVSRTAAACLKSAAVPLVVGKRYEFKFQARRRSGAAVEVAVTFRDAAGQVTRRAQALPSWGNWTSFCIGLTAAPGEATLDISIRSGMTTIGITEIMCAGLSAR